MIGRWLCRHDRHTPPSAAAMTFLLAINMSNPRITAQLRKQQNECKRCRVTLGAARLGRMWWHGGGPSEDPCAR